MPARKVAEGEDLIQIAFCDFGVTDVSKITDRPENRKLFESRTPRQLCKGDSIYFPESGRSRRSAATSRRHRFVRQGRRRLKLELHGDRDEPLRDTDYHIVVNGQFREGRTDGEGVLDEPIPMRRTEVRLTIGDREIGLLVAHLDPIETIAGCQARLNNLGYVSGPVDGIVGPRTEAATRAFQQDAGIGVDGIIGPVTRAHLQDAYGC